MSDDDFLGMCSTFLEILKTPFCMRRDIPQCPFPDGDEEAVLRYRDAIGQHRKKLSPTVNQNTFMANLESVKAR